MVGCWDRREEMEPAVTDPEVRASWTDDRDRYWTFLVSVEGDPADALADAAERLAAFNCTRTAPRDYLHATVKQVGFVVDDPSEPDEVSPETADRVADAAAADALADAAAFEAESPD